MIVAHVALVYNGMWESVGVSFLRVVGVRPRRRVGESCRGDHAHVDKVSWYVDCGLVAFVFAVDVVFVGVAYAVVFPIVSYARVGSFPPLSGWSVGRPGPVSFGRALCAAKLWRSSREAIRDCMAWSLLAVKVAYLQFVHRFMPAGSGTRQLQLVTTFHWSQLGRVYAAKV